MSQRGLNSIPTLFLTAYLIFSPNAFVLAVEQRVFPKTNFCQNTVNYKQQGSAQGK